MRVDRLFFFASGLEYIDAGDDRLGIGLSIIWSILHADDGARDGPGPCILGDVLFAYCTHCKCVTEFSPINQEPVSFEEALWARTKI